MADSMRRRFEGAEQARLVPWALRSADATRRHAIEDEGRSFDYRTRFQRDRDRIVYSRSFRRLRQKAQFGILPAYEDHRRNRLTHTLEVTQLARTIGRALGLNEDLIEAVALGHDLGQPPFGPIGERALDDLFRGRLDGRGGPGLGDVGGFRRGRQGLRTVDLLEKRYPHPGLNLCDDSREGILKSDLRSRDGEEDFEGIRAGLASSFEVQVVVLADRISGALHDLDDALQSGMVDVAAVERLAAVKQLQRKLGRSYRPRASRFMKANAIHRGLIHLLVTSAIVTSGRTLRKWAERHEIESAEQFRAARDEKVRGTEIGLPPSTRRMLGDVEAFVEGKVRRGYDADRAEARGRRIILGLFAAYQADPTLLDDHVLLRFKETRGVAFLRDVPRAQRAREIERCYLGSARFARVLGDHLAAMTDAFAVAEHARLLEMGAIPIPSAEQLRRERP